MQHRRFQTETGGGPSVLKCIIRSTSTSTDSTYIGQVSTFDLAVGKEAVVRLIIVIELPISLGEKIFFEQFLQFFTNISISV